MDFVNIKITKKGFKITANINKKEYKEEWLDQNMQTTLVEGDLQKTDLPSCIKESLEIKKTFWQIMKALAQNSL